MNKELLLANLRTIPDFPIPGILFYDVTTLFKSPECLQELLDTLYEQYKDKGITKVVGIEASCRNNRRNICQGIWNRLHSNT